MGMTSKNDPSKSKKVSPKTGSKKTKQSDTKRVGKQSAKGVGGAGLGVSGDKIDITSEMLKAFGGCLCDVGRVYWNPKTDVSSPTYSLAHLCPKHSTYKPFAGAIEPIYDGDENRTRGRGNIELPANYGEIVRDFSIWLNIQVKEFEEKYGANIFVGNVGFIQYPERYPGEEKLQIHDHFKSGDYFPPSHPDKYPQA